MRGWLALGAVLLALILVPFLLFEAPIEHWVAARLSASGGWPVGLLIAGLLASDIFLPIPSSIVSTAAGLLLGFGGGLLASTTGMCAGSLVGYALGAAARGGLLGRFVTPKQIERAAAMQAKYGAAALVVSRPIPVLAEASAVLAGMIRMPLPKFWLLTSFSNLGISAAYSAVGAFSFGMNSLLLAFLGAIAIPAIAIGVGRVLRL